MIDDLKIIKKKYGEKMSHLCRELFPTILEKEGLLSKLLMENFAESHFLYEDIKENDLIYIFKNFIYMQYDENNQLKNDNSDEKIKTPQELLNEVGYDLYECLTEEDIQQFKKYYAKGEELCTFNDRRLNSCRVFFAVKKDVDNIKREDFKNPKRQDLYGTSVISIQFMRDGTNHLSIKNRYNHRVVNPDATFSNNLDNIVAGLTKSFEKTYDIIQNSPSNNFEIPNYVRANDGKYYKYNYEIGNIYYCPNNIIIDNFNVKQYDKEKYIILDYFILDLQNKTINLYDDKGIDDDFVTILDNIEKIRVESKNNQKFLIIQSKICENIIIILNQNNQIYALKQFNASNLKEIGNYVLFYNNSLEYLDLPSLEKVGYGFLANNNILKKFNAPNLKEIGNYVLFYNNSLEYLDLPNLEKLRNGFLYSNNTLKQFNAPNLKEIGYNVLYDNNSLENLDLPSLETVGRNFLFRNKTLKKFNAPKLKKIGDYVLCNNNSLEYLELPSLETVGRDFLSNHKKFGNLFADNNKNNKIKKKVLK